MNAVARAGSDRYQRICTLIHATHSNAIARIAATTQPKKRITERCFQRSLAIGPELLRWSQFPRSPFTGSFAAQFVAGGEPPGTGDVEDVGVAREPGRKR